MKNRYAAGILLICLICGACTAEDPEGSEILLSRTGGIELNSKDGPLIAELSGELVIPEGSSDAFGADLRSGTAYRFSLETGETSILAPTGRGPQELSLPVQLAAGDEDVLIYDNRQDMIAIYDGREIVEKFPAYGEHSVWVRGFAGYVWNGKLITSIVDPEMVRELNFEEAAPIGIFDYRNNELEKAARFSPTIDELDAERKYPVIWLDSEEEVVWYMLETDHTLMTYDLNSGEADVFGGHKHSQYRVRSEAVSPGGSSSAADAMQLGTSMSQVIGIYRVGDRLIVAWQNFNEEYYESRGDDSPGNVDYFGVGYDLSDPDRVVEFDLPGRFLGVYGDYMLIEEGYDSEELRIGFYEFVE